MEKETFDVLGMTCAACQANVTKAVKKLDGVDAVDVSLLSNSMKVEYDPTKVTSSQIEAAVDAIGYQAVSKNKKLNESQTVSIQEEWDARQKHVKEEMQEKKSALVISIILLCILMCFSMLPMFGIFKFFMDMKWMMVSSIMQLVLCMLILFFQRSFFVHGFKALIKRAPNMDSLVAVGSAASFLYGLYGILRMAYGYGVMDHHIIHSSMDALYFEGAAMIVTLVSLGKYLEARSKAKTGDALGKLVDLAPKSAVIEKDGVEIQVAADQVVSGDLVVIRPGQRIPVDGIVASGVGYVDQAAITGESVPVEKQPGDEVMSATINVNGTFKFTATKVGSDTTLAQIIRLVDEAGNSKAPIARLADTVAGYFVPVVMGIALVTFIGWMIAGRGFGFALSNAICVLVISCPCALGLATPLAIMVSTGKAAEYGILVKSAASLETLHAIKTVVLDKTGTITSGKPVVVGMEVFDPSLNKAQFMQLAASAETGSEHPLGKAVVEYAKENKLALLPVNSFEAVSGRGLKAHVHGQVISAGNLAFMEEQNIQLPERVLSIVHGFASKGQTPLLFGTKDQVLGVIAVADTVRPTSAAALKALKKLGIETVMLTGDNEKTAKAIASTLDIDRVISDVLPADKEKVVSELQKNGRKAAMVGDGINDAPALMRADVGIAIGAGTDIAIEAADVVLMKDNLMDVVTAVELSRKTITNIKENLFWAFFYNCLGIPVAMGLLYPKFGWLLNPMWGAAAMSFSSVTVCLNALRLRFFKPHDETPSQIQSQRVSHAALLEEEEVLSALPQILEQQAQKEEQEGILLQIDGMSCEHCVAHVKEALTSVPGVVFADVSLMPPQAFVTGSADVKDLMDAIEEAGYKASLPEQFVENIAEDQQPAPFQQILLHVDGMMCDNCVHHVQSALESVDGVKSVQVSLADKQAVVQADSQVDANTLIAAVEEAGYEASVLSDAWNSGIDIPDLNSQQDRDIQPERDAQPDTQPEQECRLNSDIHAESKDQTESAGKPNCTADSRRKNLIDYGLNVSGMMCDNCVHHVLTALQKIDGVVSADVSLENKEAFVQTIKPVEMETLISAIEEAGYEASPKQEAGKEPNEPEKKLGAGDISEEPEEKSEVNGKPVPQSAEFDVSGMMCENCEHHVVQALLSVPCIQEAQADAKTGKVKVFYTGELEENKLQKAVEEAGYEWGSQN